MNIPEGYKQTEMGMIPKDWDFKPIGEIARVSSGGTPNRSNPSYWNGNIPWITTSQIDFNTIIYSNEFITKLGLQKSAAKLYAKNTLLMAMYGQGKTRGKVAILGIDATINQACAAITLNKDVFDNYIFFYLAHNYEEIRKLSNTGNQENLNGNIIKSIFVPIPPLNEQKAIAQSLSDVDALITECDRIITKKRNTKQGTMQELLTGKKRLPGFSGEWEVRQLREIVEFSNGKAHENSIVENGKFIVINSKFISTEGEVKKYSDLCYCSVSIGQIVMVMSDVPNGRAIAKCFYIDDNDKYTLNQRICSLKSLNVSSRFLFYLLDRNPYYLTFDDGVKQTNLRKEDVLSCPLTLPGTLEEQKAIAQILSDMDTEIAALEQKRDKYKAIKQGMMQELLTGKTRLISRS
ncbi:restriction endonuclease subunit S [Anabaena sp. CCY 9402-a]|uniref:restriction endonuclease subunit S n=1 Tax=Anabaena sp. CCY 9402-a TaxID=3103867 RepID=UPI0039C6B2FD